MTLWAIRNKHTGAYLRGLKSLNILMFGSEFAAYNFMVFKKLNPEYFEVTQFRR